MAFVSLLLLLSVLSGQFGTPPVMPSNPRAVLWMPKRAAYDPGLEGSIWELYYLNLKPLFEEHGCYVEVSIDENSIDRFCYLLGKFNHPSPGYVVLMTHGNTEPQPTLMVEYYATESEARDRLDDIRG